MDPDFLYGANEETSKGGGGRLAILNRSFSRVIRKWDWEMNETGNNTTLHEGVDGDESRVHAKLFGEADDSYFKP